jgi:diacylglycerol diphosphate phosphatase/phosphatidate phosphatase
MSQEVAPEQQQNTYNGTAVNLPQPELIKVPARGNDAVKFMPSFAQRLKGLFEAKTIKNGYMDLPHVNDYNGYGYGYGYGYGFDGSTSTYRLSHNNASNMSAATQEQVLNPSDPTTSAPTNDPYYGTGYATGGKTLPNYPSEPGTLDASLVGPSKFILITDFPSRLKFTTGSLTAAYILETLSVLLLFALALVMYSAPYPDRYFRLNDPSISYPVLPVILPDYAVGIINTLCPAALILIIWVLFVRNGHDLLHAILGLCISLAFAFFFTTFLWVVVGGFRPDFLERCNPNMATVASLTPSRTKTYSNAIYFSQTEICQGYPNNQWNFGGFSPAFPSATAATAMAGWFFAMLYICAKTNTWRLSLGHFWKFLPFVFFPICVILAVSLTRLRDNSNGWWDVTIGWGLGLATSLIAYRLEYCSIFGMSCYIPNYYLWRHVNKYILSKLGMSDGGYEKPNLLKKKTSSEDTVISIAPPIVAAKP